MMWFTPWAHWTYCAPEGAQYVLGWIAKRWNNWKEAGRVQVYTFAHSARTSEERRKAFNDEKLGFTKELGLGDHERGILPQKLWFHVTARGEKAAQGLDRVRGLKPGTSSLRT